MVLTWWLFQAQRRASRTSARLYSRDCRPQCPVSDILRTTSRLNLCVSGHETYAPFMHILSWSHNNCYSSTSSRKNFTSVEDFVTQPESRVQCTTLEENVKLFGVTYFGMTDRRQGIVHVIGPEEGFTVSGSLV